MVMVIVVFVGYVMVVVVVEKLRDKRFKYYPNRNVQLAVQLAVGMSWSPSSSIHFIPYGSGLWIQPFPRGSTSFDTLDSPNL